MWKGKQNVEIKQEFLIALGGNQPSPAGSPKETLRAALAELTRADVQVMAVSRFYQTPCFPAGSGPDYVNAAAIVRFDGTAQMLLERLHATEAKFGRTRTERWGARGLDLDLLAQGDQVLPSTEDQDFWRNLPPETQAVISPDVLVLPHPRLQDRAFVLVPLAEIAPDWPHPRLGLSVARMLAALPPQDRAAIRALPD